MTSQVRQLVLQLEQASSDTFMSAAAAFADFTADLSHGAAAVGFTEVHKPDHRQALARACGDADYRLVGPASGEVALAVSKAHRLVDTGVVPSLPAAPTTPRHGVGHTARPILWATFIPAGTTEHVTVHVAHWVTRRADTGGQQLELTQDMAQAVRDHARGARLGFWLGDTNNPDRPHDVTDVDRALRKGELTSCWDELGRYPATHGASTLDVVGSYDPDGRVTCLRARRWHQLHSDHIAVSAWYAISPPRLSGAPK